MWTYSKLFRRFSLSRPSRGFTLVELLVVSAIVLIFTAMIFFRQARFNSTTILRSLTYSVALSVRQAQVYGTSVRETSAGSGVFAQGYGVYIPSFGSAANTYYIFADADGDGAYDVGEGLPIYKLGSSYALQSACTVAVGASTCTSPTSLTVYFRRPNPDACIASNVAPTACAAGASAVFSRAYITLVNTVNTSDTRSIKVTDTGQISVCQPNLASVTTC